MTRIVVSEYDDLRGAKMSERGRKRVLRELAEEEKLIAKLEEWVIESDGLQPIPKSRTLVRLDAIRKESDNGYLIVPTDTDSLEWVGKSVCTIYEPDPDGIETAGGPQTSLFDIKGGRR